MEPETSGLLGMILGAVTGLGDANTGSVFYPQANVPAEYRPLELATDDYSYAMRPAELTQTSIDLEYGPALLLEFAPLPTDWLADITTQEVGEQMSLIVCGEEITTPVIQEPIVDGQMMLSGTFTLAELTELAELVTGARLCETPAPAGK